MFGGGSTNPYDDIVSKTTDENLTTENWELILNLCDKVSEEGQEGARNVISAILKRLAHRNPNVQLYALSLAEALSKNCGIELHREIASRAFTQGLEKVVTDRTTHDKVRTRTLGLVALWTAEFENDPTLGVMQDCYDSLSAKNYNLQPPVEPLPPTVDDEIRRKEEEELQRVLEMSMQDKGGRNWDYTSTSTSSAGASGSGFATSSSAATRYNAGYVPAAQTAQRERTPSPVMPVQQQFANLSVASPITQPQTTSSTPAPAGIVTRVKALHTFTPTEPGELPFEKGDVIKVVDRGYKDWWRGQLKGRTGIFPVNYVESLPEPTPAEIAAEAQAEWEIFSKAADVERLLSLLKAWEKRENSGEDISDGGLADDEEVQELYRSSMALRPKIVKLIDKYSQKRADLVSMNETFVRARTIFDRMMEESLARHAGNYGPQPTFGSYGPQPSSTYARAGSGYGFPSASPAPYGQPYGPQPQPQGYQAPYSGYGGQQQGPQTPGGYPGGQPQAQTPGYGQQQQQQQQSQPRPAGYGQQQQSQPQPAGYEQQLHQQQPAAQPPGSYIQAQQPQPQPQPQSQPQSQLQSQPQPQPLQQQYQQPASAYGQYSAQGPTLYPAQGEQQPSQQQQPEPAATPNPAQHQQTQTQVSQQRPVQTAAAHTQQPSQATSAHTQQASTTTQQASQAQAQAQPQPSQQGPPYIFDPNATYKDPNVQAWAQYYARGGKDLAGAVYFVEIPGVTDQKPQPQPQPEPVRQKSGDSFVASAQPQQQGSESVESLPLPSGYAEQQPQEIAGAGAGAGLGRSASFGAPTVTNTTSSPVVTTSTPSWVLPKRGQDPGPGVGA